MKRAISFIDITKIQKDPTLQVREQISEEKVTEYAQALSAGVTLPPIVLFGEGERYWLADGWHRLLAYERNGSTLLSAEVFPGGRTEALLFAVGANAHHGLPRTNADKRRAIRLLLSLPGWAQKSDRIIARQCALTDHHLVAVVRRELEGTGGIPQLKERQGADGKIRTLPQREDPEPAENNPAIFSPPPPLLVSNPRQANGVPLRLSVERPEGEPGEAANDLEEEEKQDVRHPLLRSGYVHWNTPPEVLEVVRALGPISLDPCSNAWSQVGAELSWREEEDGLSRGWYEAISRPGRRAGLIFINPPFGAQATPLWVARCVEEANKGAEIVLLVPARTDLDWFQEGVWSAKAVCFWRDRIEFWKEGQPGPGPSTFPSLFAYWGPSPSSFAKAFSSFGRVFSPPSSHPASYPRFSAT